MIKLERAAKPSYLTSAKVSELSIEYINSGKSVWNTHHLKDPLLKSSQKKCAYCECTLSKNSNYMEVEHFEDKKHSPGKVVEWINLLPSCKKCNGHKGTHDVRTDPIINPFDVDPRDHLVLRLYRLRGKTEMGECTIDVANLNHSSRLVSCRFDVGEKIDELLDSANVRLSTFLAKRDTRSRNKLVGVVEGMLEECQTYAEFSASTATVLLSDPKFLGLVASMKGEGVWTGSLDQMFDLASDLVLEVA